MDVTELLFGGGAVDPSGYYQKRKTSFTNGLNSISCTVKSRNDQDYSNPFIPPELNLSKEDMQRLIIATQLAIPDTSVSYLKGRPESYDHSPKSQTRVTDIEDRYPADRVN